jgi:hypothetical protein
MRHSVEQQTPESHTGRDVDVFISAPALCNRWKISKANLQRAVVSGRCPAPVRIVGGRRVVWMMNDVLAHEAQLVSSKR